MSYLNCYSYIVVQLFTFNIVQHIRCRLLFLPLSSTTIHILQSNISLIILQLSYTIHLLSLLLPLGTVARTAKHYFADFNLTFGTQRLICHGICDQLCTFDTCYLDTVYIFNPGL